MHSKIKGSLRSCNRIFMGRIRLARRFLEDFRAVKNPIANQYVLQTFCPTHAIVSLGL